MQVALKLKQFLVTTPLADLLERRREASDLRAAMQGVPEKLGMLSHSACAKAVLPRLCHRGSTFVDVGAHIGSVMGAVRRHDPSVRLVAVEAVPSKAKALETSFPGATVHAVAVGPASGQVSFFVDEQRPGYSSLSADRGSELTEIHAPMRTLDDLLAGVENVSCIKIDVEGHELGVVRGASAVLEQHRPAIQFESGPRAKDEEHLIGEIYDCFAEAGYELLVPNRVAHDGPALSKDGFYECHFYPFRTLDYFALPTEKRIDYRDRARTLLPR